MMDTQTTSNRFAGVIRRRVHILLLIGGAVLISVLTVSYLAGMEPLEMNQPAPELTQIDQWLNSGGLKLADQKGKVVILHFWTYACINCQHNLPYYNKWQEDFAKEDVQIIGVHTPETSDEADPKKVAAQVKKLDIKYPVAIDSAGATWKAYDNHYWPSIYLIDKQGRIRYRWDGELEYQNAGGNKILREKIKVLLAESAK
jgi:peroxiredoxin